jgi:hypothetical protein
VLWDEKRREDAVRELGIRVLRVTWHDLGAGPAALAVRLRPLLAVQVGHRPYRVLRTPEPGTPPADAVA